MFSDRGIHSLMEYGIFSASSATITTSVTLSADTYYYNLTVSGAGSVNTNGYRLFIAHQLTMSGTAVIHNNGQDGGIGGPGADITKGLGGPGGGAALVGGGFTGGGGANMAPDGGVGTSGGYNGFGTSTASNTVYLPSIGAIGGAGGDGSLTTGGAYGAALWDFGILGDYRCLTVAQFGVMLGYSNYTTTALGTATSLPGIIVPYGGSGGGGGGSNSAANRGGGGGGGGGIVFIAVPLVSMSGSAQIQSLGGNGGDGYVDTGGGGPGGGGSIILHCDQLILSGSAQLNVNSGTFGAGTGGAADGDAAFQGAGTVLIMSERGIETYATLTTLGTYPTT